MERKRTLFDPLKANQRTKYESSNREQRELFTNDSSITEITYRGATGKLYYLTTPGFQQDFHTIEETLICTANDTSLSARIRQRLSSVLIGPRNPTKN